jgi:hypothetical protein
MQVELACSLARGIFGWFNVHCVKVLKRRAMRGRSVFSFLSQMFKTSFSSDQKTVVIGETMR